MKPTLLLLAVASTLLVPCTSVSAQDRARGKDVTPAELRESLYRWGDGEREDKSFAARLAPAEEKWTNRYTAPFDGFVVLPSGERLRGKLILHNRYTPKAMRPDAPPPNDILQSLILTHDAGTDTLTLADIAGFGAEFRVSQWVPDRRSKDIPDSYRPGFVEFGDERLEGLVALVSIGEPQAGLRSFVRVYYAADASSPVEVFTTPGYPRAGMRIATAAGQTAATPARYGLYQGLLIDQGAWIAKLERSPRQLSTERLLPGEVEFHNGAILRGRVGLQSGRSKSFAYLIDEDQDLLHITATAGIKVVKVTEDGAPQHYVVADGEFVNNADAIAGFEKNEALQQGRILLTSGQEFVGKVALRRARNLVRSYRIPLGAYYVPEGEGALLSYYSVDDIELVEDGSSGATVVYVPLDTALVPQEEFLAGLEASKSRDETRNLHGGSVTLTDGSTVTGRIAQRSGGMILVDQNRRLTRYTPRDSSLRHFDQTIDGQLRRFIPLQGGIRAFSDGRMEFVELMHAEGEYSYYRNPNPTHLRRISTALVKTAINTGAAVGQTALANEAAKQAVQARLEGTQPSPGDLAGAVAAGADAQQRVYAETAGLVEVGDEGGLYKKEWVVVHNPTNDKVVVYSGNDTEELTRLLNLCARYATLDRRAARRLLNVDNLDEAVRFLNACR